jgi:hypothetical protein
MKRKTIIESRKTKFKNSINSKIKKPITDPYEIPGFQEAVISEMNILNNSNYKSIQEVPAFVFQVPADLEKNGIPIGKLLNQAIYYVANDKIKEARKCLISFMPSLNAKIFCKDEIALQKRRPEEKEKYFNKPMPEEFKINNLN